MTEENKGTVQEPVNTDAGENQENENQEVNTESNIENENVEFDKYDQEELEEQLDEDNLKKVQTLQAQKDHFKRKTEKLQAKLEAMDELRSKIQDNKDEDEPAPVAKEKKSSQDDDANEARLARIEFIATHRELDSDDAVHAQKIADGYGISLEQTLEHPVFTAYRAEKARQKKAEEATPAPGTAGQPVSSEAKFKAIVEGKASLQDLSDKEYQRYKKWRQNK